MVTSRTAARRRALPTALLGSVLATLALSSCGGSEAASDVPVVDVQLGRYTISPGALTVPAGDIELRVTNTDNMVHNLVVAGRGTRNLNPGETQLLPVRVEVAQYRMWCDIPGHAQMGQSGTMIGQDAPATPAGTQP